MLSGCLGKSQHSTKKKRHLKNPTPYHNKSIDKLRTEWDLSQGDKSRHSTLVHLMIFFPLCQNKEQDKDVCSHNLSTALKGQSQPSQLSRERKSRDLDWKEGVRHLQVIWSFTKIEKELETSGWLEGRLSIYPMPFLVCRCPCKQKVVYIK